MANSAALVLILSTESKECLSAQNPKCIPNINRSRKVSNTIYET